MGAHGDGRALVGRLDELAQLRAALRQTRDGNGSSIVIGGESGVGKTRLITEFLNEASEEGATVLAGGCTDFASEGASYWPFIQALRTLVRLAGDDVLDAKIRARFTPELSRLLPSLLPLSEAPPFDPYASNAQMRMFDLVIALLSSLSRQSPVVLVIEDLHWADRSTRDLFRFIVADLNHDPIPVLVIGTYRTDAVLPGHSLQQLLVELRRGRRAELVALHPFTRKEVSDQVKLILGKPPAQEVLDFTWDQSDGNAFMVEELVAAIQAGYGLRLPASLRQIILSRIDLLSNTAQKTLRAVAVAGETVSHQVLDAVAGLPEESLLGCLRECVDHQVLVVDQAQRGYNFRHSSMREVVYDELLPGERNQLHAAYGRVLTDLRAPGDEAAAARLAYHWSAAGDSRRALLAALDAAAVAVRIHGFAEAQRHYERAIELWPKVPDAHELAGVDRLAIFERAAEAANLAGEHRRATALISAASAELAIEDTPVRVALFRQRLGRYLWDSGDSSKALTVYEEAVRLIPSDMPTAERANIEGAYAEALRLAGRYRESLANAETALVVAREVGARLEEAQILATLGFDLAFLGDPDSGVAALKQARDIAEELSNPDEVGRAYLNLAELLSGPLNRLDEAVTVANDGATRARELGLDRSYGAPLRAIAINTLFRLGRWSETDDILRQAFAAKPTGTAAIELCLAKAKISVGRGDFEAAELDLETVASVSGGDISMRHRVPLLTLRAGLYLWQGKADMAREAVAAGIAACVDHGDDIWLLAPLLWHGLRAEADRAEQAWLRRAQGDLADATSVASQLLDKIRDLAAGSYEAAPPIQEAVSAYLLLCEAEAARAEGKSAAETWASAAFLWEQLEQPYPCAYARWREGEARLTERTHSSLAASAVRAAHQIAVRLGARPLRIAIEQLAGRARISLSAEGQLAALTTDAVSDLAARDSAAVAVTLPRFARLTLRELEVLLLMAEGRSNREIGDQLFISDKTASVHVSHILTKLGVNTRVQASALVHAAGPESIRLALQPRIQHVSDIKSTRPDIA